MSSASDHIVMAKMPKYGKVVWLDGRTREITVKGFDDRIAQATKSMLDRSWDRLPWYHNTQHASAVGMLEALLEGWEHDPVVIVKEVTNSMDDDPNVVS